MERIINSKFIFTGIRTKRKHLLKVIKDLNRGYSCGRCFFSKFEDCAKYQPIAGYCDESRRTDNNNCHFKLLKSQKLRQ